MEYFPEYYEACYQRSQGFITEGEFRAILAALTTPEEDIEITDPTIWWGLA